MLLACCGLAVLLGVLPGQDANWDLRNYHFYNPYAWLNGRLDLDVAPAQIQSWLIPIWDLWYFSLARAHIDSRPLTGLLSLPAGVALYLLGLIGGRISPAGFRGVKWVALLAVAATAAGSGPLIGTTMSEWHNAVLILLGAWLVLVARDRPDRRMLLHALAGLCSGVAMGLKLTAMPFAAGLAAMVVASPGSARERASSVAALAAGGAAGFLAIYGPWGWMLYRRYANPFFPFFNDLFHSPLVPWQSYRDDRYAAKSLVDLLALPLRMARAKAGTVAELPLRDMRLALALPSIAFASWRTTACPRIERGPWRAATVFFLVSFVLWARLFAMIRYAGVLELFSALFITLAVTSLAPGRWGATVQLIVAGLVMASTAQPQWGRVPHGAPAVLAQAPSIPKDAMVVIATLNPVAYVVPSLPPQVPVVALVNNFLRPGPQAAELQRRALERVRRHPGPLLLLTTREANQERYYTGERILDFLTQMSLEADLGHCRPVRSPLDGDAVVLCPLAAR